MREEARAAKYQGTVLLYFEIPDRKPANMRALLSLGADWKAIEAVQKWEFEQGRKAVVQ